MTSPEIKMMAGTNELCLRLHIQQTALFENFARLTLSEDLRERPIRGTSTSFPVTETCTMNVAQLANSQDPEKRNTVYLWSALSIPQPQGCQDMSALSEGCFNFGTVPQWNSESQDLDPQME